MNKNSEMGSWLKLNLDWRDALVTAELTQTLLDAQIKHYYDGLGEKPTQEEVLQVTLNWEAELHARQQLFEFMNLKELTEYKSADLSNKFRESNTKKN